MTTPRLRNFWLSIVAAAVLSALVAAAVTYVSIRESASTAASNIAPAQTDGSAVGETDIVILPEAQWDVAGIRIRDVNREEIPRVIRVTGKLALNADRLAEVYPQVEGIVRDVPVRFGQDVTAGQTLVVIDSQQIGNAALELLKSRLASRLAEVDYEWRKVVEKNVQQLIALLQEGIPLDAISERLSNRDMGEYRAQLMAAYAKLHKSAADYERLKQLDAQGVTPGKDLLAARAVWEADRATMDALLEQTRFTSHQDRIAAENDLEKARRAKETAEANLRILGVPEINEPTSSAATWVENISQYRIGAPFSGTVISKDAVLDERVDPASHLFTIVDLSTVWVKADVFEHHIQTLEDLENKTIRFRADAYPDRVIEGRVFYTGAVIDEKTRTLPMTAVADNPDHLLKPGMFVEVELPEGPPVEVLAVPATAIQEHQDRSIVFVHIGGEEFTRRDVATGRRGGGVVEITAGLVAGEPVVVQGAFFLKSQMLAGQFGDDD